MSTKKKPITARLPEAGKLHFTTMFHMSVNAESCIDKDRHYPLGYKKRMLKRGIFENEKRFIVRLINCNARYFAGCLWEFGF
ncbi:hypothetical protein GCM10008014_40810 [Paenibacillus silvae]|uniref:Transposase n=1 Tax=Paenibacillus silvae TaxID=1325358 RepID=A0ABQ1ZFE5_9BACL|nr:hypothetical protein GCM10008014_40810 [Paenibacillus silvae]